MDLIYCQKKIPKEKWRYGLRSSAAVGCGWIATYNAMALMGYQTEPEELIRYYERQVPLLHGNVGTFFWGPAVCFLQWGFPVRMSRKLKEYDALAKDSDVCILFYHWRHGMKLGAHFVALQHTPDGFIGYNTYSNSTGPDRYGESLQDFIQKKKFFGTVLIGIKRRGS